jgi:uncharacterized SAM-binding protein YcdF (DUF218 family)
MSNEPLMKTETNFRFKIYEEEARFFRWIKKTFLGLLIFLTLMFLSLMITIPYYSQRLVEDTKSLLYDEAPDVIVVFTGDQGRVEHALKLASKYPTAKLYISGVFSKNSLITLVQQNKIKLPESRGIDWLSQNIEIDYAAQNTIGNVLMTLNYIRQNYLNGKVLVISSNYHFTRINLLFSFFTEKNEKFSFIYEPVKKPDSWTNKLKKTFFESLKFLNTLFVLLLWDHEDINLPQE